MIGKVIGALLGREIDRRDGSGGVKGAMLGATAAGALRRTGPLGMMLAGGYVAKKLLDRRRASKRGY
ncbi:hypothetical protein [Sphingomonas solaris]|uniref:Uncharacterized protein n=1 Tax=Alterirhizorhabdus solaris TaxID=2529389 RepID=A0A558QW64_9SPHN|nr:hypothetical protein [Sphingomonas solaris]TVV71358.1 hypothetical protein FOY91_17015 [Sphingomonas solaris]